MKKITVDPDYFLQYFPYFQNKNLTPETIGIAYEGASTVISTNLGEMELPKEQQIRGVYLATAHQLYLNLNPDIASQGKVASASEGSVSASFTQPQYKNWLDYWLSLSPYGIELMALLSQVQPPMPRRPVSNYPYYGAGFIV